MSDQFEKKLSENELNYGRSLARIIDKYSRLSKHNMGLEVDLENIHEGALEYYMKVSKAELDKFESQRLTELRDESIRTQDTMRDSQLDFTCQSGGADGTCGSSDSSISSVSSAYISVQDNDNKSEVSAAGTFRCDSTQLTVSFLDESQRTISEAEQQPEDQDEELEMTLSRNSSLVELYPGMISRIKSAVHRQQVSEVANSVLRRYRRWRLSNSSLILSAPLMSSSRHISKKKNSGSEAKRSFIGTESSPRSHLQTITNQQDWQQHSPGRERNLPWREQHRPILAMDISGLPNTSMEEMPLSPTFIVSSDEPQRGQQPTVYAVSPTRSPYSSPKATLELSLRSKRLINAAQQVDISTSQSTAAKERPDIYGSPVRQSPLKTRIMSSLSRSPLSFSRSPKVNPVETSQELVRPRPESLCVPQLRTPQLLRMFSPQDSRLPPPSRSASAAESCHRLRRHLSFDSALVSTHISYSPQKVDEEFIKLYHKFVCQNKSTFFKGFPCRLCARSSEASRGSSSSSALAALALSPHRSVLRKRHRELSLKSPPQSKRFRDEFCTSSPGSSRYRTETLRRRLCPPGPKQPYDGPSNLSPSKPSRFQSFNAQQRPVEHCQTWMSQNRSLSAAEFPGHGRSCDRNDATGSPRKRW